MVVKDLVVEVNSEATSDPPTSDSVSNPDGESMIMTAGTDATKQQVGEISRTLSLSPPGLIICP